MYIHSTDLGLSRGWGGESQREEQLRVPGADTHFLQVK